jgi:ElaA protein
MNWKALGFAQMSAREIYLILRARSAVFVVERSCVYLDADGHDETALHVFAVEDMSLPMPVIAYARIQSGDSEDPEVLIDRVLTSPARRGDGTAEMLIERVLQVIAERWPACAVRVTAPVGLRAFYERFGFRKSEGPFLDHGTAFIVLTRRPHEGRPPRESVRHERAGLALVNTYELL